MYIRPTVKQDINDNRLLTLKRNTSYKYLEHITNVLHVINIYMECMYRFVQVTQVKQVRHTGWKYLVKKVIYSGNCISGHLYRKTTSLERPISSA